jgi:hypothetical protein
MTAEPTALLSMPVLVVSLVALGLSSCCVLLHYEALSLLNRVLPRLHIRRRPHMLVLVFSILALHSLEIFLFALGYMWMPDHPAYGGLHGSGPLGLVDYGYFSAVVFTTLGLGDIVPVGPVRIMTGAQSLVGFVLITWSASFTFIEMQTFWKRG